ncbi:FAD-dependent oxidoreductase [Saccharibacillus sp. CPCC 101409]|uniref:FAD-dependent oxidoreductase n=1 Tax=Saccharibacillus sp. CPCC 101409 TaxID=3058041 RepID=UPI0026732D30|nr:FAD-dependent oxidoreductase [Saccharibacillus sp. CPCC 101409]MDO3411182.1 FAD-dependent oxidoreductase [Saccharibacillus sp. CPCC 101409]
MRNETVRSDITVVGGGLAGVCAAIAAARLGRSVALVQNRPVLGGNSSSEVRVWVCGATAHGLNRYARETGIMGELFVENQYRNPEGNPYLWDLVVLEAVKAESDIALFLNTDVHEVEADGPEDSRRIRSATGWMMGSERRIRFESEVFLDCTGDGLLGFLAGARYMLGREARDTYNEEWAPEIADDITLGSTMLFYTKDAGRPVKFEPPFFAKDIAQTSIPLRRVIRSGDSGCHYWWIEWGGERDTVHDNERIRDELASVIYGIWDYIKNSGQFDADNLTLEWVGSLPGKREYRRFVGDYVLNQNDIVAQRRFEDDAAFGGWSIDLHPPQGMYATESGSKHYHMDGVYHVPFRSLYSANVDNMLMAGRNISASHVAFGTTRVMATCAAIGEAAGTGAALCSALGVTPRELYARHTDLLRRTLLRRGASVVGLRSDDGLDLAREAAVDASGSLRRLALEQPGEARGLARDAALLFPADPGVSGVSLLLSADEDAEVTAELWDTGRGENYVPHTLRDSAKARVESGGEARWVRFDLNWRPDAPQNAFLIVRANAAVKLYHSAEPLSGVLAFERGAEAAVPSDLEDRLANQPVVEWQIRGLARRPFCFRLESETDAYNPAQAVNGYHRPFAGPRLWNSGRAFAGHSGSAAPHAAAGEAIPSAGVSGTATPRAAAGEADTSTEPPGTRTSHAAANEVDSLAKLPNADASPAIAIETSEPWLRLTWDAGQTVGEVHLTFNDDVNEDLVNLHHHRTEFDVIPELVRDYRLEAAGADGRWTTIASGRGNRRRRVVHKLAEPVCLRSLRLVVEDTNGSPYAELIEIRVYADDPEAARG